MRKYSIRVRLTKDERTKLEYFAKAKEIPMSEVIQDYIKSLPTPIESKFIKIENSGIDL